MSERITLKLNSLVRRTERTAELKLLLKNSGASLCRQGRSRNWSLSGNHEELRAIRKALAQQNEESWGWLAKLLSDKQPELNREQIKALAKSIPQVTVKTLSIEADCTLKEAREIIDELEWE